MQSVFTIDPVTDRLAAAVLFEYNKKWLVVLLGTRKDLTIGFDAVTSHDIDDMGTLQLLFKSKASSTTLYLDDHRVRVIAERQAETGVEHYKVDFDLGVDSRIISSGNALRKMIDARKTPDTDATVSVGACSPTT